MKREPRFPGIDWYCDKCGMLLNSQKNFDDHKYVWKCKSCGYKNSISWDNICRGDSKATKCLLYLIGFLSYIGLWTAIMLAVSMFVFHADCNIYLIPFYAFLGLYIFMLVLSVLVEFGLRHTRCTGKNIVKTIIINIKEDIISPFFAIKELVCNLLAFASHKIPIKRKYNWYSNKLINVY